MHDSPKDFEEREEHGRFFKKGSSVLSKMHVKEYSFEEISEAPTILPDNESSTVFYERLHAEQELNEKVQNHETFNREFNVQIPPTFFPRDFTDEWEKSQRKSGKKRKNLDEEDIDVLLSDTSIDDDINEIDEMKEDTKPVEEQTSREQVETPSIKVEENEQRIEQMTATPERIVNESTDGMEGLVQNGVSEPGVEDSLSVMGEAIKGMQSSSQDEVPFKEPHAEMQSATLDPIAPVISEEEREKLVSGAKAEGFEVGFKEGEEKAAIHLESRSTELFGNIDRLASELENLQKNILEAAEHNYMEIVTALCETVLEREVSLNPGVLKSLIEKSIQEITDSDVIKIKVNPKLLEDLKSIDGFKFIDRLVADESKEIGQFEVETNIGGVSSDLGAIIKKLIDQAEIELFDTEKAG